MFETNEFATPEKNPEVGQNCLVSPPSILEVHMDYFLRNRNPPLSLWSKPFYCVFVFFHHFTKVVLD